MTALPQSDDVFVVIGENENGEYRVNLDEGTCTCPDATYNLGPDEKCKHRIRCEHVAGEREIPVEIDAGEIDPLLGEHVDDAPAIVASDGGEVADERETSPRADCWCVDADLPCFEHYRGGER